MEQAYCNKLMDKKEQLTLVLDIVKDTTGKDETREYFSKSNMLKEILRDNDLLDGVDIECVGSLEYFASRAWLFKYKGRGYVLYDCSNGHYKYCCTAEELVYALQPSDDFFNGNL